MASKPQTEEAYLFHIQLQPYVYRASYSSTLPIIIGVLFCQQQLICSTELLILTTSHFVGGSWGS